MKNIIFESLRVPDSVMFGKVTDLKRMGKFTCLRSVGTNSLVCYMDTTFKYHLTSIGSGPGEYLDLHAFAIDTLRNELIIFDRNQLKLCFYNLLTSKFIRESKFQKWVSNIELINDENWIVTTDIDDEDDYLQIYSKDFGKSKDALKTSYQLIKDAVFPTNFSYSDSTLLFQEPFNEVFYEIDLKGNCTPILQVDFENFTFPDKYWASKDIEFIENKINSSSYAFGCHLVSKNKDNISFFYRFTPDEYRFVRIDLNKYSTTQIGSISEEITSQKIPYPTAVYKDTYLRVIYPEELKTLGKGWWSKHLVKHPDLQILPSKSILLLKYQI